MIRPRILILEDDPEVGRVLRDSLARDDMDVHLATDCAGFEDLRAAVDADLFIIDLGLPDGDGFKVARNTRMETDAGIIIVTARAGEVDAVMGLESCADDYVVKPFRVRELRARVRSVLRRSGRLGTDLPGSQAAWMVAGCRIDPVARRATGAGGGEIPLTRTEFEVLMVLLRSRGRVQSRDRIVDSVRGEGWAVNDRLVDGIISRVRRKVVEAEGQDPIRTVRGIGYVIDAD